MSVEVNNDNLSSGQLIKQKKDSYGLPVQESSPRGSYPRQMLGSPSKQPYGVRVPVLREIDGNYLRQKPGSCRFDIVEKVTTVIKPGAYGPQHSEDDGMELRSPKTAESNQNKRITVTRQPTYNSMYSSLSKHEEHKDSSVLEKIGPYHWNTWIKTGKEGDARDVLYKNTYCLDPEQVRYRTLTLPRISTSSTIDRPWTVAGDEKPVITKSDHGEYNKVVTIVPQQPRGTVVRFREYLKPSTYASEGRPFAVKSYKTRPGLSNSLTTLNDGFPLIRHDFRRLPRKTERPLKCEAPRYSIKKSKETLFNKHILPAYKQAFDRDYSSADTFKEYLDSLQTTAKANTPGMHTRAFVTRNTESRELMNYHNEALKSVSDVNQPQGSNPTYTEDPHEISVDIRKHLKTETADNQNLDQTDGHKPPVIDHLSSVHGSVVRAHSDTHSVTLPRSSSIVDGKSIVKIPGAVSEAPNAELGSGAQESPYQKEGDGSHCPANTPTPDQQP